LFVIFPTFFTSMSIVTVLLLADARYAYAAHVRCKLML